MKTVVSIAVSIAVSSFTFLSTSKRSAARHCTLDMWCTARNFFFKCALVLEPATPAL